MKTNSTMYPTYALTSLLFRWQQSQTISWINLLGHGFFLVQNRLIVSWIRRIWTEVLDIYPWIGHTAANYRGVAMRVSGCTAIATDYSNDISKGLSYKFLENKYTIIHSYTCTGNMTLFRALLVGACLISFIYNMKIF